ncbi:MAG: CHAT domain-containing protein [Synechococcales cyanobacterium RM1_1_8]|nr:CHAT domain-containing protein [Synechococcales cyanobacterium RM1_1_8]
MPQLRVANSNEALAFASTKTLEGITPADILSLKLQANLVTIQGFVAQVDRGDRDSFALPQAFLAAGVPMVIAATGDGDDLAAQKLMVELYQRLKADKALSPAQALRQAMLQVRKQHPEAKDWAGFAVMGQ